MWLIDPLLVETEDRPVTSEKKTLELCADELHKGVRCILARGHAGDHESQSSYSTTAIRWKQSAP